MNVDLPDIKKGDIIEARYLNKVRDAAVRALGGVGVFANDDLNLAAPVIGGRGGGGTSSSVSIVRVLIDDDIEDLTEYVMVALETTSDGSSFENPPGTTVDKLLLRPYKPVYADLKVFRLATSDDPGFIDDDTPVYILATKEVPNDSSVPPDESVPGSEKHWEYVTKKCEFIEAIKVGSYRRSDYPDYGEDDPWPPPSVVDPDTFFKKCYLAPAINGLVLKERCKELEPPELPEDL